MSFDEMIEAFCQGNIAPQDIPFAVPLDSSDGFDDGDCLEE
jgi:hypothetical protein